MLNDLKRNAYHVSSN